MKRGPGGVLSERWEEVDRLFDEALDLPPVDRDDFLTRACAGDEALRSTLSRLLTAAEESGERAGPGGALLGELFDLDDEPEPGPSIGMRVGPYRIVREVGRGGMATVFEAERADGVFEGRVAIKVVRSTDSGEIAARFAAERQILSSLDHPNIARLFDGGTTEDGRPYLVMELVDGQPITRWADGRSLTIEERLVLFEQVVEAVEYAHAHLVVHRDLKPSNVVVDAEGRVRLLDFGIAKLLEPGGDTEAGAAAEPRGPLPTTRWMTPEYAAPEQIVGGTVTTATDVHALGVLLHELLAGARPFAVGASTRSELERVLDDAPPPGPSASVGGASGNGRTDFVEVAAARSLSPERLRRRLVGDLDAIVLKALRRKPSERYPTARDLGRDLERYRTGRPVAAREGLLLYRLKKLGRRHWLPLSAAVSIVVVLAASSVVLARQQAETLRQRDRAESEAANSQLVVDFLSEVFRGGDPNQAPADTMTARELLEWGSERVRTEYADQPEVQGDLFLALGSAYSNLGLLDEALEHHQRALELKRASAGDDASEVIDALTWLGALHRARIENAHAAAAYSEGLALLPSVTDAKPESHADLLHGLGLALRDTNADSAEILLRRSLAIRRDLSDAATLVASTELSLAYVLRGQNRLDEARALYERAIPVYRASPSSRRDQVATHLNNLAYVHRVQGDYTEAEALYRESLSILTEVYGAGNPRTLVTGTNLAAVLDAAGRYEEAVEVQAGRVTAAEAQWPDGHWRVGQVRQALASALIRAGRLDEGEAAARAAVEMYTRELGAQHDWTEAAIARVAIVRLLKGENVDEMQAFFDRLHGWFSQRRAENGGTLPEGIRILVQALVTDFERSGLAEEAARFGDLLEDESPGG